MLVGILGAIAQDDVRRILSFNIVSHIGYMAMGIGLFTVAGIAGAIFYVVHHIVAITTLFLTSGLIEHICGSTPLSRLGEMVRRATMGGPLLLLPALCVSPIPTLSGLLTRWSHLYTQTVPPPPPHASRLLLRHTT